MRNTTVAVEQPQFFSAKKSMTSGPVIVVGKSPASPARNVTNRPAVPLALNSTIMDFERFW
jgi:hypothetical protein